jgi:hypothetical protein
LVAIVDDVPLNETSYSLQSISQSDKSISYQNVDIINAIAGQSQFINKPFEQNQTRLYIGLYNFDLPDLLVDK